MKKTISFQLDEVLLARLDEVAQQGGANRSEVLRRMISMLVADEAFIAAILSTKVAAPNALLPAFGKGR